jgi:hypothetical protein
LFCPYPGYVNFLRAKVEIVIKKNAANMAKASTFGENYWDVYSWSSLKGFLNGISKNMLLSKLYTYCITENIPEGKQ